MAARISWAPSASRNLKGREALGITPDIANGPRDAQLRRPRRFATRNQFGVGGRALSGFRFYDTMRNFHGRGPRRNVGPIAYLYELAETPPACGACSPRNPDKSSHPEITWVSTAPIIGAVGPLGTVNSINPAVTMARFSSAFNLPRLLANALKRELRNWSVPYPSPKQALSVVGRS